MCPCILTRRLRKRALRASSNDYPLGTFPNEPASINIPPPIPRELPPFDISASHDQAPREMNPQTGSVSVDIVQGPLSSAENQASGLTTAFPTSTTSAPLSSGDQDIAVNPPDQRHTSSGETSSAKGAIARPEKWYCHKCQTGPYLIATTLSCINMTSTGICGHPKCHLCRVE